MQEWRLQTHTHTHSLILSTDDPRGSVRLLYTIQSTEQKRWTAEEKKRKRNGTATENQANDLFLSLSLMVGRSATQNWPLIYQYSSANFTNTHAHTHTHTHTQREKERERQTMTIS